MKNEAKAKKKPKTWVIVLVVILVCCLIAAVTGDDEDEAGAITYTVVSTTEYARDGQECIGYRVAADTDITDDDILAIFEAVADDDYYLHTVWIYSSEELAEGGDAYDVAMAEETAEGETPEITRAN